MYVCMNICVCVYVRVIGGDVCMFMCMLIYVCVSTCVYLCECVDVQFCMKTNILMNERSISHSFSCKIEHVHTHTQHTCTHIHRLAYT